VAGGAILRGSGLADHQRVLAIRVEVCPTQFKRSFMNCMHCGSNNVQRLEMIFDAGTQQISTRSSTLATGYSHGELVTGTASTTTTGTAQTTLAAKVAPPQKKSYIFPIFATFIGCETPVWFFSFVRHPNLQMCLMMIISGAIGYWGLRSIKNCRIYNTVLLPQLKQQWRLSWMCHMCGTIFQQT